MKPCRLLFLLIACFCPSTQGVERFMVGRDGSISGKLSFGDASSQPVVFRFGLPHTPVKSWQEGAVLRNQWITNGIRLTQTVLLFAFSEDAAQKPETQTANPVLLVNIEGENTNSHYAEASAELIVERGGKPEPLGLKGGLVWLTSRTNHLLGVLEVPDSGIRVATGDVLRFSGSMPPSIKGSMTWKIPLAPLTSTNSAERLLDVEFERQLRGAAKSAAPIGDQRLSFHQENP